MVVFIPVYNIFFTAKDFDDAVRTGDKMMDSFFQYWIEHMGFNKLNNHLIKIGFKNLGVPRRMKATIRTFPKEMADTSKFRVVTSQRMAEGMKRIA